MAGLLTLVLSGFGAASAVAEEVWYVVMLGDQRAGHMRQAETRADGQITTQTQMQLEIARGPADLTISVETGFVETAEGEPLRAEASLNLGGTPIVTTLVFHGDTIEVTTTQGSQTGTQTVPAPDVDWLPPAAMGRYVEDQLAAGAETIAVTTIDPATGPTPFTSTMTVVGEEDLEVFGRTVPATVWDMGLSTMPGLTMRGWVDATGLPLKSTVALMPGLELTVIAADKHLALSPLDPPELMASTLIEPTGKRIERPRSLRSATYLVRASSDRVAELPDTAVQRGAAEDDGDPRSQRFRVDLNDPRPVQPPPDKDDLSASTVLNHEDPAVIELRDDALAKLRTTDPNERAEVLRRYVHDTIDEKDLSVGFATASEVARTKQGDCSEHAVLLAALLRSADIPSRGVSGLVYVEEFLGKDGVFGYHMWTQAWLDPDGDAGPQPPRWVDLDATLGPGTPFDATHIALHVTDLNDPALVNDMVQLAPLIGNLKIEVIFVEYAEP